MKHSPKCSLLYEPVLSEIQEKFLIILLSLFVDYAIHPVPFILEALFVKGFGSATCDSVISHLIYQLGYGIGHVGVNHALSRPLSFPAF